MNKNERQSMMQKVPNEQQAPEEMAEELRQIVMQLYEMDRRDLILKAIGVPMLELLRTDAAQPTLSRLIITADYELFLERGMKPIPLDPIHRSVYIFFLYHPEGIEFKQLPDYREELLSIYKKVASRIDEEKIEETVARLTNPLDNAMNEKCSRIKSFFAPLMDEYQLTYYIISSHTTKIVSGSSHVWFRRLKLITLPRELVVWISCPRPK